MPYRIEVRHDQKFSSGRIYTISTYAIERACSIGMKQYRRDIRKASGQQRVVLNELWIHAQLLKGTT